MKHKIKAKDLLWYHDTVSLRVTLTHMPTGISVDSEDLGGRLYTRIHLYAKIEDAVSKKIV